MKTLKIYFFVLWFISISSLSFSQVALETKTLANGMTIIKPSMKNFINMIEMSSTDWITQVGNSGFNEGTPYGSARTGYIIYSKGKWGEGGCAAIEKMGKNSVIYNWYHSPKDPTTIFAETLIELENYFFKKTDDAVAYNYVYKGKKYKVLYMSSGSQTILGIDQY
jgi:hypothetical protein